jgi:hypothetical protein
MGSRVFGTAFVSRRPSSGDAGASVRPPAYGIGLADVHRLAEGGVRSPGVRLPHAEAIQRSFGPHDVSSIVAHVDPRARRSADGIGALAYARGEHVAFARAPDLRLAAHEAAHVMQQRAGVRVDGGLGRHADRHEQLADAVADRVVAGRSATDLLSSVSTQARVAQAQPTVQCYQILGHDKIYAGEPASRPWFGYP